MKYLLSTQFWLNVRPGAMMTVTMYILIGLLVIFLTSIVLINVQLKKARKTLYKTAFHNIIHLCWTNLIIGVLVFFFMYEEVPFLSARFWFVIWAIELVTWIWVIVNQFNEVPKIKAEIAERGKLKKYIP
jgi:hypothetical protein